MAKEIEMVRDKLHWLSRRLPPTALRAIAGRPVEFSAREIFHVTADEDVRWSIAGERATGSVMRWIPLSPGRFVLAIETPGRRRQSRSVTVGLCPGDLITRREALDYYFCLILNHGTTLRFIPLLEKARKPRSDLLRAEVAQHHPAFAKLLKAQTDVYRQQFLRHPFVEARTVRTGLHAIFSHDLVYLGSAAPIREVTDQLSVLFGRLAELETGRGQTLMAIEALIGKLDPTKFGYQSSTLYPVESPGRGGTSAGSPCVKRWCGIGSLLRLNGSIT